MGDGGLDGLPFRLGTLMQCLNFLILSDKESVKSGDLDKENYRPVSVLSNVSKIFERIICSRIDAFLQDKLSKLLTGFCVHA